MTKRIVLFLWLSIMLFMSGLDAQSGFFSPVVDEVLPKAIGVVENINSMSVLRLDEAALRQYLLDAPMEFKENGEPLSLEIPLPDGSVETFKMLESPILSPEVGELYPEIKTYAGNGTINQQAIVRLSLTSSGFSAIILYGNGETVYFQKYSEDATDLYFNYFAKDARLPEGASRFSCGVEEDSKREEHGGPVRNMSGATLRTFRLAMAGTGEYTANHGGTAMGGYNAIVEYVNAMNITYRNELSVSFVLVSTAATVYTNAATDPYTQSMESMMLTENQDNLDMVVGSANYDIGHLMGANPAGTSPSGLASFGVVCDDTVKGQGWTKEADPLTYSLLFNQQVLFHETGHMFGMNHSYNSNISICTTRNWPTSVEPGSGATIMSYGYTCDDDDYFPSTQIGPLLQYHTISYSQAIAFLGTISCNTSAATGNTPPVVTVPGPFTIPVSTPFSLTGSADAPGSGDSYTYCWEGTNIGIETPLPDATTLMDPSKPPFFRSYPPTTSTTRTYPLLSAILDGTNIARGDKLPSIGIATTHRFTVRDNNAAGGGVTFGETTVTVDGNIGPFLETTNLAATYPAGSTQNITWSVNGTNVATPTVNVLLSVDGGLTFPYTLATATGNDGTELVTFPNVQTSTARIKVEAVGNIFFDISNFNFGIEIPGCTAVNSNICPTDAMTFDQGDAGLDLGLSNTFGAAVTQVAILLPEMPSLGLFQFLLLRVTIRPCHVQVLS